MSVLNRRGFLTGGLFATTFAIATLQGDMLNEPAPDDKKSDLHGVLRSQHPDIDSDLLKSIADEFGDYKLNPLRPYIAGAAAAGTYSLIKVTSDENGKTNFFNRLGAGMAPPMLFDNFMGHTLSNLPETEGVYNSIKAKGVELKEEQAINLTRTVLGYLYVMQHGAPSLLPSAFAMMTTELVEKQLNRQDANKQDPDGP